MKFGITTNYVWSGPPITEVARHIEALNFESMWMGEHPIIPAAAAGAVRYGVPLPPNYRHMPALFVSLAAAAAVTSRIRLGTNVCLVTQRDPLLLAKETATLDRISGGRLIFAYGTGWIPEEADVFGYRFDQRLGRALDAMRAVRALWSEDPAGHAGEHFAFPPVHCFPKPLQQPGIPVLIGSGNDKTDNARILRRVARSADGWLPSFLSPAQMHGELGLLRELCEAEQRDFASLDISLIVPAISLGVGELPSWGAGTYADLKPVAAEELVQAYAEAGVSRLLVGVDDLVDAGALGRIEAVAKGVGLI